MTSINNSLMEIDQQPEPEEDPFLAFVDYAKTVLYPETDSDSVPDENCGPGWSWIATRILKTCISYSSGVTTAILLSDLSQAWSEQQRGGAPKKMPEYISQLKRKYRRKRLPNTVTIDSIYEKSFLSLSSALEVVVLDVYILPGTNIYMLTLGDFWSSNTLDLYLHRRYYDLASTQNGILKKGREVLLSGCYIRSAHGASGHPRLLPTEYLVVLLDEDQDDDAMLIAAQFYLDSFSSVSLEAFNKGASYSLFARIESIRSLEVPQRKQITLVDNDGVKMKFILWGEQALLANLLSVGSMLGLDRPYIASSIETAIDITEELYIEYGSATQVFMVPFIQHEEQISITLTQNRCQGSRVLGTLDPSQGPKFSQVSLPCDSQGSIDFSSYPFRSFVIDLQDKMTGISLYGVVIDLHKEKNTTKFIFSVRIEDSSGAIWAKLHFSKSWSLGKLGIGHTVYISGLVCSMTKQKHLEVLWFESKAGAFFVNLSRLPALLNSSCLHKLSRIADLTSQTCSTQICQVWLDQIEHVNTKFSHALCGQFVAEEHDGSFLCCFCQCSCDAEVLRTFDLRFTLADDSSKVLAWCTGQTAAELLQISPDEFHELPEEEQVIYPSSLENEKFIVTIVNCSMGVYRHQNAVALEKDTPSWEITRALKYEWR